MLKNQVLFKLREKTSEVSSIHLAYLSIIINLNIDNPYQVKVYEFSCVQDLH